MPKVAVACDLDGTLVDTEYINQIIEQDICRMHGLNVPESEWHRFRGQPLTTIFSIIREEFGGEDFDIAELIALKQRRFVEVVSERGPRILFPDTIPFLNDISKIASSMAVVTAGSRLSTLASLQSSQIGGFFSSIVTSNDVEHGKPYPDPYLLAAHQMGCKPEDVIALEDTANGVRSAVAAGCFVIGVRHRSLEEAQAFLNAGARWVQPHLDGFLVSDIRIAMGPKVEWARI